MISDVYRRITHYLDASTFRAFAVTSKANYWAYGGKYPRVMSNKHGLYDEVVDGPYPYEIITMYFNGDLIWTDRTYGYIRPEHVKYEPNGITRYSSLGSVYTIRRKNGVAHGISSYRFGSCLVETPYINGVRHGLEVKRDTNGICGYNVYKDDVVQSGAECLSLRCHIFGMESIRTHTWSKKGELIYPHNTSREDMVPHVCMCKLFQPRPKNEARRLTLSTYR